MVFGTLDGEVVAMTHESEKIVSYIPSLGAMNSVLGLSWLKKYPSKNRIHSAFDRPLTMWKKYCLHHCFALPLGFTLPVKLTAILVPHF
ncbi:protein DWD HYPERSENSITIVE TO UV-B 1 isoform X2 [Daucus carota subsp. sativus]|uniref:protein DWD HYPERSENSITIVE TO UV-B 1 isoform X2 n=1 Tax=Daucus carota subsp. sativus TaxID=79200 RepID=UPI003082B0DA